MNKDEFACMIGKMTNSKSPARIRIGTRPADE